MNVSINKATTLIEALPYIHEFKNKIFVIKYGGSAMTDEFLKVQVLRDVALLKTVGILPVVVHGGGKDISSLLTEVGKSSQFVNGMRATTISEIDYVEMMLSGKINKQIVGTLNSNHCEAVGISGRDAKLLLAEPISSDYESFERVGKVSKVNPSLIKTLLAEGFIPVISPIGTDEDGNAFNINADEAAAEIASALMAEKLIVLTDVDGVMNEGKLMSEITAKEARNMIESGVISGGMIPKISCCLNNDVANVHILNGTIEHAILLEIFTDHGVGTKIIKTKNTFEESVGE